MNKLFSGNTFESMVIYAEDDKTLVMDEELEGDFGKLGDTLESIDDVTELQDIVIECKDKPELFKEHLYRYSHRIKNIAANLGMESQLPRYLSLSSEQIERGMDADLVSRLVLEESKGFLSELWHRIKMFFTKIFEAIAGIFVGFDDKKESAAENAKKILDEATEEDLSLLAFSNKKAILTLFSEKETKTYDKSELNLVRVIDRYETVSRIISNIVTKSQNYNKERFERVNKYIDKLIEYSDKDEKLNLVAERKKDEYFSEKKAYSLFSETLDDSVKSSFGYNEDVVIGYKITFNNPSKGITIDKVNVDDKIKLEGSDDEKIKLFADGSLKNRTDYVIEKAKNFIAEFKTSKSINVATSKQEWEKQTKSLEEKIKKLDEKKGKKPELHSEATKVLNAIQTVYKNELQTLTKLSVTLDKIYLGILTYSKFYSEDKKSKDSEDPKPAKQESKHDQDKNKRISEDTVKKIREILDKDPNMSNEQLIEELKKISPEINLELSKVDDIIKQIKDPNVEVIDI